MFNLCKFGSNLYVLYIGEADHECENLRERTMSIATLRFRQFPCIEDMVEDLLQTDEPDVFEATVVVFGPESRVVPVELCWIRTTFHPGIRQFAPTCVGLYTDKPGDMLRCRELGCDALLEYPTSDECFYSVLYQAFMFQYYDRWVLECLRPQ